jgi:hypothetical protein
MKQPHEILYTKPTEEVFVGEDEHTSDFYTEDDIIDAMVEYADQFTNWIPVSDPPGQLGKYLVTNGRATLICGMLNDGSFFGIGGATHWMPLPNPPAK